MGEANPQRPTSNIIQGEIKEFSTHLQNLLLHVGRGAATGNGSLVLAHVRLAQNGALGNDHDVAATTKYRRGGSIDT